jgi:hypothetical protein
MTTHIFTRNYFVWAQGLRMAPFVADTMDDALLYSMRLRAIGHNPKIVKNPCPRKIPVEDFMKGER